MQINMLSLKDLKEFDVKNIDVAKLLKGIQQRTDVLINVALILGTLFFIGNIYSRRQAKVRDLTVKITALEGKIKAISDYEKSKDELSRSIDSLPKGIAESDAMVNKINEFAITHNIQILSFVPADSKATDLYSKRNLRMTIATSRYENLGLFVKDIENSGYNLRVERWSASLQGIALSRQREMQGDEPPTQQINAEIEIAAIDFKK